MTNDMENNHLSLPSPGLWPREKPRHTDSHAEIEVYNSLKNKLPEGWYAWHSLNVHREDTGEHGETDFVVAIPNRPAILLIEVKGGQIEQRDGRWYQNNKSIYWDKFPFLVCGYFYPDSRHDWC